jgi:hypothetical protein
MEQPLVSPSGQLEDLDGLGPKIPEVLERPLFCTWPSCNSRFQYRYDWSRHEEALHYCPFHWVCCNAITHASHCLICKATNHSTTEHCGACLMKDMQSRTFLREDQLTQHIKRAHLSPDATKRMIPKDLLSAWKIDNPFFSKSYLHCGFCGVVSDTWAQRQDHVHDHLKKGICKSSWWPERQPAGDHTNIKQVPNQYTTSETTMLAKPSNDSFCCPSCGEQFDNFVAATQLHRICVSWSCRYLHGEVSSWTGSLSDKLQNRILSGSFDMDDDDTVDHQLRGCAQTIYTTPKDFASHLDSEHRIKALLGSQMAPWARVQFLEIIGGQGLVRTTRLSTGRNCCPSVEPEYTFSFVTL